MTLDEFLSRLQGVRPYKSGHMALCPSHDDKKGSLSIRVFDDIIRLKCFAGCEKDTILSARDLTWKDLYVKGAPDREPRGRGRRSTLEWVLDAEYDYTDESGEVEFQVVRKRPADGSMDKMIFQRRPVPGYPGQWALGLGRGWYTPGRDDQWREVKGHPGGADQPPGDARAVYLDEQRPLIYRLGDFMAGRLWVPWPDDSFRGRWLFVVEGEKKVEALADLMVPGTTCAQGAGKWKPEHAKQLRLLLGVKRVLLSPDNDVPGFKHMVDVARTCWALGIETIWTTIPDLAPKGDVADLLAQPHCRLCEGTSA